MYGYNSVVLKYSEDEYELQTLYLYRLFFYLAKEVWIRMSKILRWTWSASTYGKKFSELLRILFWICGWGSTHCAKNSLSLRIKSKPVEGWSRCNGICLVSGPDIYSYMGPNTRRILLHPFQLWQTLFFFCGYLNLVWHSAYSPTPPAEGGGGGGRGKGQGEGGGMGKGQADNSNTSDSYISQIKAQSPSCCLYR